MLGAALSVLLIGASGASARAQQGGPGPDSHDELEIQHAFEAVSTETFAQSYPQGKRSIVGQELRGTSSLLTTAHRLALRGRRHRERYRQAVVYQVAARQAMHDQKFAVALYLTLHARELGHSVILANTSRGHRTYPPDHLELIKRAGGFSADTMHAYVHRAGEEVPPVAVLFVDER